MRSESIIDVAIRQFGDRGFEGTSTRSIAAAAETVMSSITYHFGGKEGLYLTCADHIASKIADRLAPTLERIESAEHLDRNEAVAAVAAVIETLARLMLNDESRDWAQFIIREQQTPGPAFERIYAGMMKKVIVCLIRLIQLAQPGTDDDPARALAVTLVGQALILRSAHASILRLFRTDKLTEAQQTLIIGTICGNVRSILGSEETP